MTTYVAIPTTDIDQDSPITQPLMTALRDNLLAVAEGDASVPANLRMPTELLGTLITTSGATQTLSSLVLTPYKFLSITIKGVSFTTTSALVLNTTTVTGALSIATRQFYGTILVDLTAGVFTSSTGEVPNNNLNGFVGPIAITTATTSLSFSGGTFDAGSIFIYGVK